MNHLPLQVGEIHDVEIHYSDSTHASGRQIHPQRSAQPACADEQHLGAFQLELAFHAHFGHDQVPAVAQNLFFRKRRGLRRGVHRCRASGDTGHNRDGVAILHRRAFFFQIADVFVVEIHIDEAPQLAFIVVKLSAKILVLTGQLRQDFADGSAAQFHCVLLACVLPQGCWN